MEGESEQSGIRNIPSAEIIEDVAGHTKKFESFEVCLETQATLKSKYSFVEQQMMAQRQNMVAKCPDLRRSVAMVEKLIAARDDAKDCLNTTFQLGSNVYADSE